MKYSVPLSLWQWSRLRVHAAWHLPMHLVLLHVRLNLSQSAYLTAIDNAMGTQIGSAPSWTRTMLPCYIYIFTRH